MAGLEPLTKQDVPFRKTRNAINLLVDRINRMRPITDGFDFFPNGVRVKGANSTPTVYTPPFSPVVNPAGLETRTLEITPGYFHGPDTDNATGEIPRKHLFPYMPLINAVAINTDPPPTLTLVNAATNYIELQVSLTQRTQTIGATVAENYAGTPRSTTGATVWVEAFKQGLTLTNSTALGVGSPDPHDHGLADPAMTPQAQVDLENLAYHMSAAPTFIVHQNADWTDDSATIHYIPWGKYVLAADGSITTEEWYWTGHFAYYPPNYTRSAVSEGWNTAADRAANPAVSF